MKEQEVMGPQHDSTESEQGICLPFLSPQNAKPNWSDFIEEQQND